MRIQDPMVRYALKGSEKYLRRYYAFSYRRYLLRNLRTASPEGMMSGTREKKLALDDFDYKCETSNDIRFMSARSCLEWNRIEAPSLVDNVCPNDRVTHAGTEMGRPCARGKGKEMGVSEIEGRSTGSIQVQVQGHRQVGVHGIADRVPLQQPL